MTWLNIVNFLCAGTLAAVAWAESNRAARYLRKYLDACDESRRVARILHETLLDEKEFGELRRNVLENAKLYIETAEYDNLEYQQAGRELVESIGKFLALDADHDPVKIFSQRLYEYYGEKGHPFK